VIVTHQGEGGKRVIQLFKGATSKKIGKQKNQTLGGRKGGKSSAEKGCVWGKKTNPKKGKKRAIFTTNG